MTSTESARQRQGALWVGLQFGLLLLLALLAWPALARGEIGWVSLAWLLASGAVGGWTLRHNRLGNFNIHPEPKATGQLVVDGPYRYVRHPMYSAVLLLAAALVALAGTWLAGGLWAALLAVLWRKAELEERWLAERYSCYADYRRRTRRFVPGLL